MKILLNYLLKPIDINDKTLQECLSEIDRLKIQLTEINYDFANRLNIERLKLSSTLFNAYFFSEKNNCNPVEVWIKTWEWVLQYVKKNNEFSLNFLFELNARINETNEKYRENNLFNAFFQYSEHKDIIPLMNTFEKEVISNINNYHPILSASRIYQWLITIHPFTDGNGRVARLAADALLVKNGLPPITFPDKTQGYVSINPPSKIEITPTLAAIKISNGIIHSLKILLGVERH